MDDPAAEETDTDSATDSEREDAYEILASRIAAHAAHDQRTINSVDSARTSTKSARLRGLRRRVLQRFKSDDAVYKKDDDARSFASTAPDDDDDEAALRQALDDLEDVKVARFLERVGHRVHEVTIAPPSGPVIYPDRASFRRRDGMTDWISYSLAYLSTIAAVYVPQALLSPPPLDKLSLHFLYAEMERVYVLAPPVLAEQLLAGKLSRIWRWESPDTWKWCSVSHFSLTRFLISRLTALSAFSQIYLVLWLTDLLPALPALIFLYFILKARLFPPSPREILAEGREQELRGREAAELSKQLKSSSRVGLVIGGAARGVMSRMRDAGTERGGALAEALGGSAMLGGGVAGGMQVDADGMERARRKQVATPSAMAKALMGASSAAGGVAAGDRFRAHSPSTPTAVTPPRPEIEPPSASPGRGVKRDDGSVSLYRLVKEVGRVLGPGAQQMLADGADLGEKTKK